MNNLYTLTPMTGREASAARTVVVGGFEMNWRVWMILLWTSPVALLATLMLWPFAGQMALVMMPLISGSALYLIHRRTTTGLKLATYQAMWDKKKSVLDQFFLCGRKIDLDPTQLHTLTANTVPVPRVRVERTEDDELNDFFGGAA